jgi:hypothetical protein
MKPHDRLDQTTPAHRDLPARDNQQPTTGDPCGEAHAHATAADIRNQAIGRLRRMNVLHAQLAWQQRRRAPLAPYGLAFLFAHPDMRRPQRFTVLAATRLWKAGPESAHVDRLLFDFDTYAANLLRDKPFDIRTALANRADPIPDDAFYIGIGLSSLDTHAGTWQQARDTASSDSDIPGRLFIVLSDRTLIVCERRGLNEFNEFQIHCNHSLELAPGRALHAYSWVEADQLRHDPHNTGVLRFLEPLHETLWQADNAWHSHRQTLASRIHGAGHGR